MNKCNRKCPECNKVIYYKNKHYCARATKKNQICKKCTSETYKERYKGKKNPFHGKQHSLESREKMKIDRDKSFFQTTEYKAKQSKKSKGKNNGMYGKTVFNVWVEKYGLEEANLRMEEFKAKQSKNSSGSSNPMYGKPSPQGSGNGWSGWYKDWYFRSLKELSYVILLDEQQIKWKPAGDIRIKYQNWDGAERTYTPDFIVGNKIVEIKPTRLRGSKNVLLKEAAAIEYCKQYIMTYEIVDPKQLKFEEIEILVTSGNVKFTKRYEAKFKQFSLNF